jgi:hypothetical protein
MPSACYILCIHLEVFVDQQEYAWNWFEYHAGQRLTGFRFFLILLGALVLGYTTEVKDHNMLVTRLIAGFGVVISLAFLALEIRNAQLVGIGANALRKYETEGAPPVDEEKQLIGNERKRRIFVLRHALWFRLIYGLCAVAFFAGAIWPSLLSAHGNDVLSSISKMPYIDSDARRRIDQGGKPNTAGELNYAITKVVDQYLLDKGGIRYAHINEVVGALECAKLELYGRIAAPYEDEKVRTEGEVYKSHKQR